MDRLPTDIPDDDRHIEPRMTLEIDDTVDKYVILTQNDCKLLWEELKDYTLSNHNVTETKPILDRIFKCSEE